MNKKCNEILNKLEAEGKIKILKGFEFPKPIELKLRLKDMLEDEVDEKYYLKDEIVDKFIKKISGLEVGWIKKSEFGAKHQSNTVYNPNKIIPTITACDYKEPKKILEYPIIAASRGRYNNDGSTSQRLEINDTGNTNTITSVQKDNYVLVKEATKKGYKKAFDGDSINLEQPNSKTRRGRVGKQIANTLTTSCNQGVYNKFRIRKLTPKEAWRLMGFKDDQFEKAAKVCSNTQLYKQAGNSIVVNVLESIFENLRYIFER